MNLWPIILDIACTINIKYNFSDPSPILFRKNDNDKTYSYILPEDKKGTINLRKDKITAIACPGSSLIFRGENFKREAVDGRCSGDRKVYGVSSAVQQKKPPPIDIKCQNHPKPVAVETRDTCGNGDFEEYAINVHIESYPINVFTICFDQASRRTLYVKSTLSYRNKASQTTTRPPSWVQGDIFNLYNISLDKLYQREVQRKTINKILGLYRSSLQYIGKTTYLVKGHLSPKADQVYGALQHLTFHYLNTAPQWVAFNNGNWLAMERSCRDFASKKGKDLVIYTGTYGTCTLSDVNGSQHEIFLYLDENNNKAVPVPRVFWKVVYDPENKAAVAFLGVNNPYRLNKREDVLCKDICQSIPWIKWSAYDISKGYSYCCDVKDFRKVVTTLPSFEVRRLLN